MGQYPSGPTAIAVYAVLARRADRDGESWPRLRSIAEQAGTSPRSAQRAVRLLEVLGLVEVATCYEQGTNRQTSNLYILLTPPDPLPAIDPDPEKWPLPERKRFLVHAGNRAQLVADARAESRPQEDVREAAPCQAVTPAPVRLTPSLCQADTRPHVRLAGQEGNICEGNTGKEGYLASFSIAEVGLSNRQVWSSVLAELAKRGQVGRGEIETWLRPAALIGRDGETLIVGAPNAVARDRITSRLLPPLREAIAATLGTDVGLSIVVDVG